MKAPLLLALVMGACAPACAFEQGLAEPAMVVSVPRLPQVVLARQPATGEGRAATWAGHTDDLAVEVQTSASTGPGGTRVCAGRFLRELVRRSGMPDRDSIYRAPLDADNFLVLYVLDGPGGGQLHAHLLAAVGESHCVDAHFSRRARQAEDVDEWRTTFTGAAVRPASR